MATAIMKERLRLAAARCIVHGSALWWSVEMTDSEEFAAAEGFCYWRDGEFTSPEDAANYLLLCAEAL